MKWNTKAKDAHTQVEIAAMVIEEIADHDTEKQLRLSIGGPRQEFEIHADGVLVVIGYDEALYTHVYHNTQFPDEYGLAQAIADSLDVDMEIQ